MKFKAKRNSIFGGRMFEKGEEYELSEHEQKVVGRFFEGVPTPEVKEEPKKEEPEVEAVEEPEDPEPTPEEDKPKSKAKRK